jgi:hypothetical protein
MDDGQVQGQGASPDGDRAVVNGAASVSALRASVPSARLFAPLLGPQHCKCGRARVDSSDFAARRGDLWELHGLFHCVAPGLAK